MGVPDPVTSTITSTSATVTRAGFGVLALISFHAHFTDAYRTYLSLTELTDDGFTAADPAYGMAAALFSQDPAPKSVIVSGPVATHTWAYSLTVPAVTGADKIYLDVVHGAGVVTRVSITGTGTAATDAGTLATAIHAAVAAITSTQVGVTPVVTNVASTGVFFYFKNLSPGLTVLANGGSPAGGYGAAITALRAAGADFYAVAIESSVTADIEDAAAVVQAIGETCIFFARTQDSIEKATGTAILGPALKALAYTQVFTFYSPDGGPSECAWAGTILPYSPDNSLIPTWAYRKPIGAASYVLTTTEANYLISQNITVYTVIHGTAVTTWGQASGGQFGDITLAKAWLNARIAEAVYGQLVDRPRLPYTKAGIQILGDAVYGVLMHAANPAYAILDNDPLPTITLPLVSDVTSGERAARTLGGGGIRWSARFGGAIHKVEITGTVTF